MKDDDPATWPESTARDLALQLSGGRPLLELFSLSQERHCRLLCNDTPKGTRRIIELSLDVITPGAEGSQPYYELELEMLDQGSETDLHALVSDLKTNWKLKPEPRSKFERGLELRDAAPPEASGRETNGKAVDARRANCTTNLA